MLAATASICTVREKVALRFLLWAVFLLTGRLFSRVSLSLRKYAPTMLLERPGAILVLR